MATDSSIIVKEEEFINMFSNPEKIVEISCEDSSVQFEVSEVTTEIAENIECNVEMAQFYLKCFICCRELRMHSDPWAEMTECKTSYSETRMSDLLLKIVKPKTNLNFKVI